MSIAVEHAKEWDWPLQHNDDSVKVMEDDRKFSVELDAQYFSPKEIQVKAIGDQIQIQMDHEARGTDKTIVSRSITRTYNLPSNVDTKSIKSNLDDKGVLRITADKS
ncbi:unnamed protein product [Cylicocyclus nassatus]|uniref:SHSP domain-containing protein n=1 Tax=Cylicocyclus nassatus TaxID=53992 RepID=A0AA36H399_CYLNA|nr:unnamed protein product [Cylicocyclus nassatus]